MIQILDWFTIRITTELLKKTVQWGLKYQTRLDFEWSKVVLMLNASDFEWHSKTEPNHYKSYLIAAILYSYALVLFSIGQDHSCICVPDHSNTKPS